MLANGCFNTKYLQNGICKDYHSKRVYQVLHAIILQPHISLDTDHDYFEEGSDLNRMRGC